MASYVGGNGGELHKVDNTGSNVWTGSALTGAYTALVVDFDGYLYTQEYGTGDVYKLDTSGVEVWNYTLHTDYGRCVAVDTSGNVFSGGDDGTLHKTDSSGNNVWTYSATEFSAILGIAVDDNGYVYIGGTGGDVEKIQDNGTSYSYVWTYLVPGGSMVDAVAVDESYNVYLGERGENLIKLNSSGTYQWTYDPASAVYTYGVDVDDNGYSYMSGSSNEVHKVDSTGNNVWTYTNISSNVWDLQVSQDGYIYIVEYGPSGTGILQRITSTGVNDWSYTGLAEDGLTLAVDPGIYGAGFWFPRPLPNNLSSTIVDNETLTLSVDISDYDDVAYPNATVHFEYREVGAATWNSTTSQATTPLTTYTETLTLTTLTEYEYKAVTNYGTLESSTQIQSQFVADWSVTKTLTADDIHTHNQTVFDEGLKLEFNSSTYDTESFETDLGDWVNDAANASNWIRNSGGTATGNTGPSAAQDGTWYIYVETSSSGGSYYDSDTDIIYQDLGTAKSGKVEFYYHQYGKDQGTLSLEGYDGSTWTELWSSTGDQGDLWNFVEVDFFGAMQLRFKNVAAGNYAGDVALDNIIVTTGSYSSSGDAILNPVAITDVTSVENSLIDWIDSVESAGEVNLYTAVSSSNTTAPTTWTSEIKETDIDSISVGQDLTGQYFWIKVEFIMNSDIISPTFSEYLAAINSGEAVPTGSGSSEASITIDSEGSGSDSSSPHYSGSSEASITINVEGSGNKELPQQGSSEASITITSEGSGQVVTRGPPVLSVAQEGDNIRLNWYQ